MLYWSALFFVVALVAGIFGFGGFAAATAGVAQLLFFIFVALFLVSILAAALENETVSAKDKPR